MGRKIIGKVMDLPSKNAFTFQCITAERDRNKGTWFGLVRLMRDPQMWANKWLSQILHIVNSNAKGGVMIEEGALTDKRQFEESFAKPNAVSWVPNGTLASGRIQPKPQAASQATRAVIAAGSTCSR